MHKDGSESSVQKNFSFDQFQIALPPRRFGIMLRANWPLTRWAASHPEREESP